jgi:hypothetical protein
MTVARSTQASCCATMVCSRMFPSLCLVAYREEKRVGNMGRGSRNEALLVARKSDRPWT